MEKEGTSIVIHSIKITTDPFQPHLISMNDFRNLFYFIIETSQNLNLLKDLNINKKI